MSCSLFRRVPPVRRGPSELVHAGVAAPPVDLTSLDHTPGHGFVRCAWFFEERVEAARVRDGLAKALQHFPTLAGRLQSRSDRGLRVVCNDAGALFCEAFEPHVFAPLGPDASGSGRISRYIDEPVPFRVVDRDTPLCRVQVTHLESGGSIVGVGVCHTVADGKSFFRFAEAMARASRGESTVGPVMDRPSWEPAVTAQVAKPEAAQSRHFRVLSIPRLLQAALRIIGAIRTTETGVLRLTRADIDALKADAASLGKRCSTNDVVTAYAWRQLVQLRGHEGRAEDRMHMVVDARGRVPEVSPDYFGNAAFSVIMSAPRHALASELFAQSVRRVRATLDAFSTADFAESMRALEKSVRDGSIRRGLPQMVLDCFEGHTVFDSWARFPMYAVDFGSGRPRWVFAPVVPIPRLSLIFPSGVDGGIDVHVNLHRADVQRLQNYWRRELDELRLRHLQGRTPLPTFLAS